jgi:hypothetical protein
VRLRLSAKVMHTWHDVFIVNILQSEELQLGSSRAAVVRALITLLGVGLRRRVSRLMFGSLSAADLVPAGLLPALEGGQPLVAPLEVVADTCDHQCVDGMEWRRRSAQAK